MITTSFSLWYAFTAILVAEFMVNAYNKMKGNQGKTGNCRVYDFLVHKRREYYNGKR